MTNPATPTPTDLPEALRSQPCPFCGSTRIGTHIRKHARTKGYVSMCLACRVSQTGVAYSSIEQSVAVWNRRAALSLAPTTEQSSEVVQASPLHVDRATVIEWLDANDIEVTDRQLSDLFPAAVQPQAGAESCPPSYGATEYGWEHFFPLQEGDKRLMALVVSLYGNDHQAFEDLEALVALRARGAVPSDDEIADVIRAMPGLPPWGIGTTVKDAVRVGRAVLARWGAPAAVSAPSHAEAAAALAINSAIHRIKTGDATGAIAPLEDAKRWLAAAPQAPAGEGSA